MTPIDTLQAFLDRVSASVMGDDWETYRAGVDLPLLLITATASLAVTDEPALRTSFDDFVAALRAMRITDFMRLATSAEHVTDDLMAGRYETEMLSRGTRVVQPFPSRIILRRVEDSWRAAVIVNPIMNARWPIILPEPTPATDPERT